MMFACNETSDLEQLKVASENDAISESITTVDSTVAIVADDDLTASLTFMREEEKLARDVYQKFYELWGESIFQNIAASEQKHTTAVQGLLAYYSITDPVAEDVPGEFVNQDLQDLYDNLVAHGSISLVDALETGALIEEVDIKDLNDALVIITNEDVRLVYNQLLKGSRNHLRGFINNLELLGETYSAQILDNEYFNSIVNSEMENGGRNGSNVRGNGNQNGTGDQHGSGNKYGGASNDGSNGNGGSGPGTGAQDGSCNG